MNTIPKFGLGTWKIPKDVTENVVFLAISKCGVRHLDCACDYGNEEQVGAGISRAIAEGIIKREELWVTGKLWNTYHRKEHVELACRKSLQDLHLDYLDLFSIHFPISQKFVPLETRYPPEWIFDPNSAEPKIELDPVPYSETWRAMEDLVNVGLTRRIGVCNINVQGLMEILSYSRIKPYANQIEVHPYLSQRDLVDFSHRAGIEVTAFSPLGSPSYIQLAMDRGLGEGVLKEPIVLEIASRVSKSPAQVIIRWNIQRGNSVVAKSNNIDRIAENTDVFNFSLSNDDMEKIDSLNKNMRFNDPGEFCKGMGGSIPIYA